MIPSTLTNEVVEHVPLTSEEVRVALTPFEVRPGLFVSWDTLRRLLPDVETALFFAKVYGLNYSKLGELLSSLFQIDVVTALFGEGASHSSSLQDYIVDTVPPEVYAERGLDSFDSDAVGPDEQLLVQLVENERIVIAESIQEVAEKISAVLDQMPSKAGEMTFRYLREFNRQHGAIGTYGAHIVHRTEEVKPRLVILDVSGSMSQHTIERIVTPVVAMAYSIDASLAIVSNSTFWFEAGAFGVQDVLDKAEYGGTHYETLRTVLDEDWETVITIADYDSSMSALEFLGQRCKGKINEVLDVSLVSRPTFLAQCVGQFARSVRPIVISSRSLTYSH